MIARSDLSMTTDIIIRAATLSDLAFIIESNAAMAWETEFKTLDKDVLRKGVEKVLNEPRRGFYRVAERKGVAVGCLMVTYEWSDWRDGDWWWLQSVYVIPAARRSGVFRTLYRDTECLARDTDGVVGLRLYVEKENRVAKRTYVSLGMRDSGYKLLQSGWVEAKLQTSERKT